jgi:superfamily I DNA and/or RNA helicase
MTDPTTEFRTLKDSEVLDLTIRIKEDEFPASFDRNNPDGLSFLDIKNHLNDQTKLCFFQRQKEYERTNKDTGRKYKYSNYKLIIPFDAETAFEILVSIYPNDQYSFKLNNISHLRVVPFFHAPRRAFEQSTCKLKIRGLTDYAGFIPSEQFKKLIERLDKLNLPVVDVNKDVDKKIWHDYVAALKKLIKQKEQVWKIKRITAPYLSAKVGQTDRETFIDIYIDEREITAQFENDIKNLFHDKEVEDYSVGDEKAFIEFKNYREINDVELNKLREIGAEYFFELNGASINHYLAGEISFTYDQSKKTEIYSELKKRIADDYQIYPTISDIGEIRNLDPSDVKYFEKVLNDHYGDLLRIESNTLVNLNVSFENKAELVKVASLVKARLDEDARARGVNNRGVITPVGEDQTLIIEVATYLNPNKFSDLGLSNVESICRFGSDRPLVPSTIEGVQFEKGEYVIRNASKDDVDYTMQLLTEAYPGIKIIRRPTIYIYRLNQNVTVRELREFKAEVDVKGKCQFNIVNSTLTVNVESPEEYQSILEHIKSRFTNVRIQQIPFSINQSIKFLNDEPETRDDFWNQLQSKIREATKLTVDFDLVNNGSQLLFKCNFESREQRTHIVSALKDIIQGVEKLVELKFENIVGRTIFELYKNESLELEKEKEIARNVRQASFVYLNPEQRKRLAEKTKEFGTNAIFREGTHIGTLLRKDRDRLQFKIKNDFDYLLTGNQENRLDLSEIAKGFIKPIFPGELTNLDRMIRAMEKVTNPGGKSDFFYDRWGNRLPVGFPVNANLPNFLFDPTEARLSTIEFEKEKQRILQNLNEPLLRNQPKQLEAVVKAITAKDMALIQGPPGTGKTTVIAEIIWQTLQLDPNAKILITSQTNLAVDNALERLSGKKMVRPIRIGNVEKFEDEGKAYSNERIKKWLSYSEETKQSNDTKDNAVSDWIDSIATRSSTDNTFSKALDKWRKGLAEKTEFKEIFGNAYFKHVNVFAATCSECGSKTFAEAFHQSFNSNSESLMEIAFDVVIMDEASKATPPELVLPLTLGRKVIIIGDHKQLPPMIDEEEFSEALEAVGASNLIAHWDRQDYKISQFEKLFKNAPKSLVASLDTQFRMHEQIMNCISQFYADQEELENGLICGIKSQMDVPDFSIKASRWHGLKREPLISPHHHAIWVNVESPEGKVNTSYENEGEIAALESIVRALQNAEGFLEYYNHSGKEEEKEIGIITFYMPQMQKIRRKIYPHLQGAQWKQFELHKYENEFRLPFRINTVDKFQGMERNIIIVSTVRSDKQIQAAANGAKHLVNNNNYPRALGFARELQRINVGLSRAKRLLIVVGNQKHFSHKEEYSNAIRKMHSVDIKQVENLFKV